MKPRKKVLITGATSGIGLELARQLIARDNTVLITGLDSEKLRRAKVDLPGVHSFQSDATNPDDIAALQQRVAADFPTCDVLINNAGIMRNLNVNAQYPLTDVTKEIDVALRAPIQMVQAFLPS